MPHRGSRPQQGDPLEPIPTPLKPQGEHPQRHGSAEGLDSLEGPHSVALVDAEKLLPHEGGDWPADNPISQEPGDCQPAKRKQTGALCVMQRNRRRVKAVLPRRQI